MGLKIGLDLGASRIKVSFVNQNKDIVNFCIANRFNSGDSIGNSGYLVKYNNQTKRIGAISGIPNRQSLKINYSYLEEILLSVAYNIRKELKLNSSAIVVDIETLLPTTQFFNNGKEFRKKLYDMQVVEGVVNGEDIQVLIEHVNVNCEGVSILNNLCFNDLSKEINQVLVIDVGSSTINVVEVIKEDNSWDVGDVDTFDWGGTRMCEEIANTLMTRYKTPFKYDLLEKTMTYTFEGMEYSILDDSDCLNNIVEDFKIRLSQFKDHRQYKIIFGGGGSELLYSNQMMKDYIPNAYLLDEKARTYGNSIGALIS